jgi:hypothetical protein
MLVSIKEPTTYIYLFHADSDCRQPPLSLLLPMTRCLGGGTLSSKLQKWRGKKLKLSPLTRLKYAVNAALGLSAVHDIDGEGLSSVAQ